MFLPNIWFQEVLLSSYPGVSGGEYLRISRGERRGEMVITAGIDSVNRRKHTGQGPHSFIPHRNFLLKSYKGQIHEDFDLFYLLFSFCQNI